MIRTNHLRQKDHVAPSDATDSVYSQATKPLGIPALYDLQDADPETFAKRRSIAGKLARKTRREQRAEARGYHVAGWHWTEGAEEVYRQMGKERE